MKTRKISLILIFTLMVSMAMAQTGEMGRTSFSILGGVNFQNLNGEDNSGKNSKTICLLVIMPE